eukprot:TRINITY_DN36584_c0_g1_i1.p1 TRINITY_DN36584_c0_g1~~TRINITY_DN36584_c0_g1_i1.p1  ORF type:complete len:393 (+),score=121.42 TRINITY_DN36584_c0_g1_i1:41-1180(+)
MAELKDDRRYLAARNLPGLVGRLVEELAAAKPEKPEAFLAARLRGLAEEVSAALPPRPLCPGELSVLGAQDRKPRVATVADRRRWAREVRLIFDKEMVEARRVSVAERLQRRGSAMSNSSRLSVTLGGNPFAEQRASINSTQTLLARGSMAEERQNVEAERRARSRYEERWEAAMRFDEDEVISPDIVAMWTRKDRPAPPEEDPLPDVAGSEDGWFADELQREVRSLTGHWFEVRCLLRKPCAPKDAQAEMVSLARVCALLRDVKGIAEARGVGAGELWLSLLQHATGTGEPSEGDWGPEAAEEAYVEQRADNMPEQHMGWGLVERAAEAVLMLRVKLDGAADLPVARAAAEHCADFYHRAEEVCRNHSLRLPDLLQRL